MGKIRERALLEEAWCGVKHLLCCEEHLLETTQKLIRDAREKKREDLMKLAFDVLTLADVVRSIRQKLVDIILGLCYEYRLEESKEPTGEGK